MQRVLVTGGTGFVGRALVRELLASNILVRCAVRGTGALPSPAMELARVGEIGPDTQWTEAVAGIDAVIHLAGLAHAVEGSPGATEADFVRINTAGTAALVEAAALAGVRRMVFVSSIGVNGSTTKGRPFDEGSPARPQGAYARSKHLAEEELKRIAGDHGMQWCVVRPPMVYGPGAPGNFARLLAWVKRG